ncbi:MAG TPA: NAD(P)/FAD-dependent oxidoreductase [Gaiellaceae bacterium]|jgi:phytoene dehydrogenase-like protein|nr:NAD(P)/FAD-dependent oxidoreductase [Gaiellaceae bacterium]
MHDAVVIGAGHNGLVAANVLADAGWSVLVVEAEEEPGGSVRSGELIEPGFVNDRYSAFYPLAAASPVFPALGVEIPFRHGPLVLAHPALDGACATLERDGGPEAWRRVEPAVLRALVAPFPWPRLLGVLPLLRKPADPLEARIRLGNALHTDAPPWSLTGRAFGLVLTMLGRTHGFPCVEGGAGQITDLLVERALARGVELRLGERLDRLPAARRAVIAAVDVWELERLGGRPARRRPDPATVKVDWTLDGPVPWTAEPARRSPVVHLGGPSDFVLFGQYSPADPTRAPAGKETGWAYSHVLPDADAIEAAVERHAPGFRALVRGRRVEVLPPGRINGGTAGPRLPRPRVGAGLYLGSLSAYPGGGVHGAPGWIAAQAALRSADRRRTRGVWSFTSSSRNTT